MISPCLSVPNQASSLKFHDKFTFTGVHGKPSNPSAHRRPPVSRRTLHNDNIDPTIQRPHNAAHLEKEKHLQSQVVSKVAPLGICNVADVSGPVIHMS